VHKQNAQKSVVFVVRMDKNIVKTNKNEPFRSKNGYNLFMYQRCAGKLKTHFEKQKNLKALKANRYAEVKRNGGIVRVNRQSSQHQQSKRWEEENWKKLNKILL
jgi:hypothetical protein